ncbi:hypothetical protein EV182_000478 [Spiromyces aspiralis]|uniref:Uncharacterized protein n=1 Tax=Spiromyces aspiralis TaxID=68401 RepID=A0ACC1HV94_9FUNG|nr:hypothetical protein EV182_000478 [Spiromyces aspiralis]
MNALAISFLVMGICFALAVVVLAVMAWYVWKRRQARSYPLFIDDSENVVESIEQRQPLLLPTTIIDLSPAPPSQDSAHSAAARNLRQSTALVAYATDRQTGVSAAAAVNDHNDDNGNTPSTSAPPRHYRSILVDIHNEFLSAFHFTGTLSPVTVQSRVSVEQPMPSPFSQLTSELINPNFLSPLPLPPRSSTVSSLVADSLSVPVIEFLPTVPSSRSKIDALINQEPMYKQFFNGIINTGVGEHQKQIGLRGSADSDGAISDSPCTKQASPGVPTSCANKVGSRPPSTQTPSPSLPLPPPPPPSSSSSLLSSSPLHASPICSLRSSVTRPSFVDRPTSPSSTSSYRVDESPFPDSTADPIALASAAAACPAALPEQRQVVVGGSDDMVASVQLSTSHATPTTDRGTVVDGSPKPVGPSPASDYHFVPEHADDTAAGPLEPEFRMVVALPTHSNDSSSTAANFDSASLRNSQSSGPADNLGAERFKMPLLSYSSSYRTYRDGRITFAAVPTHLPAARSISEGTMVDYNSGRPESQAHRCKLPFVPMSVGITNPERQYFVPAAEVDSPPVTGDDTKPSPRSESLPSPPSTPVTATEPLSVASVAASQLPDPAATSVINTSAASAGPRRKPPAKGSIKQRCQMWPYCTNSNCRYTHPESLCRHHPRCRYATAGTSGTATSHPLDQIRPLRCSDNTKKKRRPYIRCTHLHPEDLCTLHVYIQRINHGNINSRKFHKNLPMSVRSVTDCRAYFNYLVEDARLRLHWYDSPELQDKVPGLFTIRHDSRPSSAALASGGSRPHRPSKPTATSTGNAAHIVMSSDNGGCPKSAATLAVDASGDASCASAGYDQTYIGLQHVPYTAMAPIQPYPLAYQQNHPPWNYAFTGTAGHQPDYTANLALSQYDTVPMSSAPVFASPPYHGYYPPVQPDSQMHMPLHYYPNAS